MSHLSLSTLFSDGLRIVHSYLEQSDWLILSRSSTYWFDHTTSKGRYDAPIKFLIRSDVRLEDVSGQSSSSIEVSSNSPSVNEARRIFLSKSTPEPTKESTKPAAGPLILPQFSLLRQLTHLIVEGDCFVFDGDLFLTTCGQGQSWHNLASILPQLRHLTLPLKQNRLIQIEKEKFADFPSRLKELHIHFTTTANVKELGTLIVRSLSTSASTLETLRIVYELDEIAPAIDYSPLVLLATHLHHLSLPLITMKKFHVIDPRGKTIQTHFLSGLKAVSQLVHLKSLSLSQRTHKLTIANLKMLASSATTASSSHPTSCFTEMREFDISQSELSQEFLTCLHPLMPNLESFHTTASTAPNYAGPLQGQVSLIHLTSLARFTRLNTLEFHGQPIGDNLSTATVHHEFMNTLSQLPALTHLRFLGWMPSADLDHLGTDKCLPKLTRLTFGPSMNRPISPPRQISFAPQLLNRLEYLSMHPTTASAPEMIRQLTQYSALLTLELYSSQWTHLNALYTRLEQDSTILPSIRVMKLHYLPQMHFTSALRGGPQEIKPTQSKQILRRGDGPMEYEMSLLSTHVVRTLDTAMWASEFAQFAFGGY